MWALILLAANSINTPSVASVTGFKSEAACLAAASAWIAQNNDLWKHRALCVKQD